MSPTRNFSEDYNRYITLKGEPQIKSLNFCFMNILTFESFLMALFMHITKRTQTQFLDNFKAKILNPLSPGVLDPGNYPGGGGPQDPQLYLAFFGLFYAPYYQC